MGRIAGVLALAAGLCAAAPAKKAAPEVLKLVNYFLETPTGNLAPEAVESFLAVDPDSLPKKLRNRYQSKRIELLALKHTTERNARKGNFRIHDENCAPPPGSKGTDPAVFRAGGFWEEIREEEESFLLRETSCSEEDLMCEFSLQIALEKDRKGRVVRRYFLHPNDPLMAYIATFRSGKGTGNTKFLGLGGPNCPRDRSK